VTATVTDWQPGCLKKEPWSPCSLVGTYHSLVGTYCSLVGTYRSLVGTYHSLIGIYQRLRQADVPETPGIQFFFLTISQAIGLLLVLDLSPHVPP
jgi:hypothetical protein